MLCRCLEWKQVGLQAKPAKWRAFIALGACGIGRMGIQRVRISDEGNHIDNAKYFEQVAEADRGRSIGGL